jgi:hypothetical protein
MTQARGSDVEAIMRADKYIQQTLSFAALILYTQAFGQCKRLYMRDIGQEVRKMLKMVAVEEQLLTIDILSL